MGTSKLTSDSTAPATELPEPEFKLISPPHSILEAPDLVEVVCPHPEQQATPESYRSAALQLVLPLVRANDEHIATSPGHEATEGEQALSVMWSQVSRVWDTSLEQVHRLEEAVERLRCIV